jgi:hypothetical protein
MTPETGRLPTVNKATQSCGNSGDYRVDQDEYCGRTSPLLGVGIAVLTA